MQVELVERARGGDQEAFASIAASCVDRCYAIAYRVLRDPHAAQDAAQQALIGAWRDLPSLQDAARFDAWLYRLVVNACYVEARSQRRWGRARVTLLHDPVATDPDIARTVAARDELDAAFRELSPEHRAVVVLHHYLGYQLTEIADVLGIPTGTARSRLHHAIRNLRLVMNAADGDAAVAGKESA